MGTGGVETCRSLRPASTLRFPAVQRLCPSGEESRRWRDRHGKEGVAGSSPAEGFTNRCYGAVLLFLEWIRVTTSLMHRGSPSQASVVRSSGEPRDRGSRCGRPRRDHPPWWAGRVLSGYRSIWRTARVAGALAHRGWSWSWAPPAYTTSWDLTRSRRWTAPPQRLGSFPTACEPATHRSHRRGPRAVSRRGGPRSRWHGGRVPRDRRAARSQGRAEGAAAGARRRRDVPCPAPAGVARAAAIDYPSVIPVYEAGEAGGLLFIAMRYRTAVEA